eukprot:NODE_14_length_42432_cov_0.433799.p9 type:complete len:429 gc:universal NODE_14_length_42432_cov_0.433799:26993-28279(+)
MFPYFSLYFAKTIEESFPEIRVDNGVLQLTKDNFYVLEELNSPMMVRFYTQWCRSCKKHQSTYESAAKLLWKDAQLPLFQADCGELTDICGKVKVNKMPSFKVFYNGVLKSEYKGSRRMEDIVDFMTRHRIPSILSIGPSTPETAYYFTLVTNYKSLLERPQYKPLVVYLKGIDVTFLAMTEEKDFVENIPFEFRLLAKQFYYLLFDISVPSSHSTDELGKSYVDLSGLVSVGYYLTTHENLRNYLRENRLLGSVTILNLSNNPLNSEIFLHILETVKECSKLQVLGLTSAAGDPHRNSFLHVPDKTHVSHKRQCRGYPDLFSIFKILENIKYLDIRGKPVEPQFLTMLFERAHVCMEGEINKDIEYLEKVIWIPKEYVGNANELQYTYYSKILQVAVGDEMYLTVLRDVFEAHKRYYKDFVFTNDVN